MRPVILTLLLVLAACSHARVATVQSMPPRLLPPPAQVVVYDFAITPDQVKLDAGVGPTLMRSGQTATDLQIQAAEAVQASLTTTLVRRLVSYGLPAEHFPLGAVPPPHSLLVQGQIVSVDEGNRTRRVLIGFGSGRSSVEADAQLYDVADSARPEFLVAFSGGANSGRMPGAAGTMGAGAVAQRLPTSAAVSGATHAGAEMHGTGNEAIANDLANALARQVGNYAVAQGWIPASAVH